MELLTFDRPTKGNRYGFFWLTEFQFSYSIGAAPSWGFADSRSPLSKSGCKHGWQRYTFGLDLYDWMVPHGGTRLF